MWHGTHTGHALMPLVLLTASGTGQPGCPMYNKYIYSVTATVPPDCTVTHPCFNLASASFMFISSSVIEAAFNLFDSASASASLIFIAAAFSALISAVSAST